jgi:hypothetical protein
MKMRHDNGIHSVIIVTRLGEQLEVRKSEHRAELGGQQQQLNRTKQMDPLDRPVEEN